MLSSIAKPIHSLWAARTRLFVVLSIGIMACLLGSRTAEAGLMTSLDGGSSMALAESQPAPDNPFGLPVHPLLTKGRGLYGVPQQSTTSSSSSTSASSSVQLIAALDNLRISDPPLSGWVTPESALALPPLLPSGLFRPPCA